MAPKTVFLVVCFAIVWDQTFIILPKIMQILKIRTCFIKKLMELNMEKHFDPKIVKLVVWGLKKTQKVVRSEQ